jgi:hypothetical protein
MSHDIQLWPRSGTLDLAAVRSWLDAQPAWTVNENSAVYENDNTDVYFVLDINDGSLDADESPLLALINVFRPSFFGRECAVVLAGLVTEFDLLVNDFLDEDITPAEYSEEWLISRWNQSNAAGHRALAGQDGSTPPSLPQSVLTEAWRWNFHRGELQGFLGGDVFVPRIMALSTPSGPTTAVVWTDAIPFVLPRVGHVVIYRNELMPRKLFRKPSPMQLQPYEVVIDVLGDFAIQRDGRIDFLQYPTPPAVRNWVSGLSSPDRGGDGLSWDRVYDTELLASAVR